MPNPTTTALLVMDYQPTIINMVHNNETLLANAEAALSAARAAGLTIAYVRVAFADNDYAAVPDSNKGFSQLAKNPGFLHNDSADSAVDPRLAPWPEDIVVRKIRVGAFSTTDLDSQLRAKNIDTLILAGISTSGVVLSTIRDAADKDYRLYILADACADTDPDVHSTLIEKVFPRQADIINVADLATLLGDN